MLIILIIITKPLWILYSSHVNSLIFQCSWIMPLHNITEVDQIQWNTSPAESLADS